MTKEREGELLMIGLSILESWFPILSIVAISHIGALHTYAFSLFISLFFFLVLMVKKNLFSELKNRNAYKDLLLTSFWITTLFALVFIGMQFTTAGNMSVIIFTQLFFSYLYFNVFGKEKMDFIHSIGAFIMGIGAIIILIPDDLTFNKGDLIILVAAVLAPIANLYSKRARVHCSSETILGFRTITALPVIALLAWIIEPGISLEGLEKALPYVLLIGLVIFGISKILWMEALHRISITKISAMIALVPPMTLLFAFMYLDEVPELRQMLGIIPVLIGGYLLTKPIKNTKVSM
ncbi:DMT family transporter [Sulfurimonas sp.]|uniref:DMT family transporter n=1 Tax=Sulfurimonas sp. TaxID=2022749 RepID=UPI00356272FA